MKVNSAVKWVMFGNDIPGISVILSTRCEKRTWRLIYRFQPNSTKCLGLGNLRGWDFATIVENQHLYLVYRHQAVTTEIPSADVEIFLLLMEFTSFGYLRVAKHVQKFKGLNAENQKRILWDFRKLSRKGRKRERQKNIYIKKKEIRILIHFFFCFPGSVLYRHWLCAEL